MKIKSIGFCISNTNVNISTQDVMTAFINNSNRRHSRSDYSRQILISDNKDFYIGLVVTFKNQKKNCLAKFSRGQFKLKVEDLTKGDKLVSFNFFCIKKKSMKGLYMYHHGSCSLNSMFTHLQTISNEFIRNQCSTEIDNLGEKPSQSDIKKINEKYNKRFEFSVITNKNDISTILRSFKEIKKATFRFDYIDFKGGPMTAIEPFTNTTEINFNIQSADKTKISALSQHLTSIYKGLPGIIKAQVKAIDHSGLEKTVNFMNCPTFFETYEFDDIAKETDGVTNKNYTS
ncbi:TPA: hypothetical protein ACJG8Q_003497, partial [Salmonella enterica subsp. diarizonae serovar 61:i:z]